MKPLFPNELVSIPCSPVPEGGRLHAVTAKDGVALRAASWRVKGARGTVVIAHGRGDYIERYYETVRDLGARGFSAVCFDFRGQGGSQRPFGNRYRSAVSSFAKYEEDLAAVMTTVVLPDCPPPYYLLAHSTGALICLGAMQRHRWFEKAVLTSPLLGVYTKPWPEAVARALVKLVPLFGGGPAFLPGYSRRPLVLDGFADNPFTSDKVRFDRDLQLLQREPSLGLGGPSFSWLRAALNSMDAIHKLNGSLRLHAPVLIVSAGRDRVVDTEAARRFAENASGIAFVVIEDAQHEILMERDPIREQFFAAFDAFVEAD
jgi:lysophospholipase